MWVKKMELDWTFSGVHFVGTAMEVGELIDAGVVDDLEEEN